MASKGQAKQAEILGDAEFNRKWEQEGQFQFLRKSNDPRFGEISLYKNKGTNDLIFAKEKLVTSKQQASNDIRDLKSRIALNHPNLHRLIGYSTAVQKELCSTNYLTRAYYEFPKSDLQKEINDRRQNGGNFSGDELVNVGGQAINGLAHLHKLDISHGDVRPLNVGYNRDSRNVQILDRLQDPSPLEKLQSNNIINKKDLYVSPEVYRKLQGKDKTLKYDPFKNDLYGLGLSLLAAGNNDSVQNIYKPNGDLDNAALDNHLRTFDNKYAASSPGASQLVHTLLAKDESQRWTAQQFVDAFHAGQFTGQAAHVVRSDPPISFTTETVTHQVYAAPPAEAKEETAVLYNGDDQPKQADNTTYVYTNAQPTYYYSSPQTTHYVNSVPTTHYVNSAPTYYVTSPTHHTTYASAPDTQVITVDPSSTTVTSGVTTVTVTRLDGSTYTYTVDERERDNIVQEYEKHDPRNPNGDGKLVSNQKVENVPQTVVYSSAPTTTVYSSPPTTYIDNGPVYHTSKVYATPTDGTTYTYTTTGTPYKSNSILVSQASPVVYTNYAYTPQTQVLVQGQTIDPSVEVRRGSSVPTHPQDQAIKKKYIIEGDNVIEVPSDN